MDPLLDRLRLLNYTSRFCPLKNLKPLDPTFFARAHANPTYQLSYFYALFAWLCSTANASFSAPGELDDPVVAATNVGLVLKAAGVEGDFAPTKIRQGYGDSVLAALTGMADRALKASGIAFKKPSFDAAEHFDEVEADDEAEVRADSHGGIDDPDAVDDDMPDETDALYGGIGQASSPAGRMHAGAAPPTADTVAGGTSGAGGDEDVSAVLAGVRRGGGGTDGATHPGGRPKTARPEGASMGSLSTLAHAAARGSATALAATDPATWRAEVERVAPRLRITLATDHKQWRTHVAAVRTHRDAIAAEWSAGAPAVAAVVAEMDATLEKLKSREVYVNSQLGHVVGDYRGVQERVSALRSEAAAAGEKNSALARDLQRVSDELESVKVQMDDLGSGMTDSKPLLNIKASLQKLKVEIKQMDVRTGVLEHQLLNGRLKHKTSIAAGGPIHAHIGSAAEGSSNGHLHSRAGGDSMAMMFGGGI
ncbi:intra-flagellar transport protein 57-domain-containing protein [Blastocladiella britannica]|nr:intra-flagellar transport protein 57-domain-containing protein [Blastocladiella britannica]